MSYTLFISDLHLSPSRPDLTRAREEFLCRHHDCENLYILGDLFETWVGDDDDSGLAVHVSSLLAGFCASGAALFLMQGNRDFLLGADFAAVTGATLLSDTVVIDLYGKPTLLMHGDSLCTMDEEYQAFRKTARSPAWQAQLLAKSLAERHQIADELRSMSSQANSQKAEDIMDITPSEVVEQMKLHGVRQLIHGHTHRPARHEEPSGLRWVLGDWDEQGWYIEATEEEIKLINFVI